MRFSGSGDVLQRLRVGKLREHVRNCGRWAARRLRNRWLLPQTGFDTELAQVGLDADSWLAARRLKPRQYAELGLRHLDALHRLLPSQVSKTLAAAEDILAHRFNLLGSGVFVPVDPDRAGRANGYRPLDWFLDPVRGLRFPGGIPYRDWKLYEMRPANADIKYPWELARCQHWPTLAQAWALTRDPRFACEILDQLDDFMAANPVGIGINWTCTMDVALRAANWALGLALILDCPALSDASLHTAYAALFEHGRFIFENLENLYEVTSNHFLSNVVGLHILAAEFAELDQARRWSAFCLQALETEMNVQVLEDGADFESSVPYHRLVAELFLGSARLAAVQGQPLSAAFTAKLARMVDYLVGVMRPDGLMPQFGDADDGRLHIFSDYGQWKPQDARHLLAPAGHFFDRGDWLALAGPSGAWESAWWGFAPSDEIGAAEPPPSIARLFPEAGIMAMRRGGDYLAVTNGRVGTRGFGNHKHNDLLGFEIHLGGTPLLVDPGSFVYTSDFAARNELRGTAVHNTLMVDGIEQNEFNPEWLFRMFEKAKPEHLACHETEAAVIYRGRHDGYARLDQPLIHERIFVFLKAQRSLVIKDRLVGSGRHRLRWHFHAAPGISLTPGDATRFSLSSGNSTFLLSVPPGLGGTIGMSWYSPSYGVRLPTQALDLSLDIAIDGEKEWRFALGPEATLAALDLTVADIA
ncbi:MAG: alginate lyase family protein, partial [Alphaproteobacteria bacterium]|nr:alginate lyase family protein [Alphaproteobacteria bacterium]